MLHAACKLLCNLKFIEPEGQAEGTQIKFFD